MARVMPAMAASGGFMARFRKKPSFFRPSGRMLSIIIALPFGRKELALRVGIVAWMHESNTFITGATTLAHFEEDLLAEGDDVRRRLADAHHEVGGFFHGLADEKIEAVPVFAARALPYATVQAAAYTEIL